MRSPSTALARLALALVLCVLSGVALAGLAFPLVGGLGLAGKSAADQFTPEKPPGLVLPQRTQILAADGHTVLATLFSQNRITVTLNQVPKLTQTALVSIEDNRFYEHKGLDVKGTLRALARNSSSGSVQQGGSTLTQQYVKNLLILTADTTTGQRAAVARNAKRKLQEARYALYLEQHMTKDQILEGYFNIAYYGSGVYGIGTAARHYFNRSVTTLDLAQGAMLAGMVQNPSRYDPALHPLAAVQRRNIVLDRMLQLGKITQAQHDKSVREKSGVHVNDVRSGCEAPGVTAPFFCDYVRRYLEQGPAGAALGDTLQERQERLLQGGLTIKTTLDVRMQADAQQAVDQKVPATDPTDKALDAAAVSDSVEPGTGAVKAMAVDRGFGSGKGQTKVNLALGGSSGYQGGSTFKAFVIARALQIGISPSLTLYSPQRYCPKAFKYIAGDGKCGPSNAGDSESGTFDMVRATWASVNTYFIQLEERTGYDAPAQLAESLGVRQVDGTFDGDHIAHQPSFTFGTGGYSPLAMAGAYATFAAKGSFCPPHPVTAITDSSGKKLDIPVPPCTDVLTADVANEVTSILRGVIDGGFHGRTGAGASIGRPAAGKTGTTNHSTAAWFIGYTPQLATAVWVGEPVPQFQTDVTINGQFYRQVFGGTIPAAIWKQMMGDAMAPLAVEDFDGASLATSVGDLKTVPNVAGLPVAAAQGMLTDLGFSVTIGPAVNAGPVPAGAVASTLPAIGARVPAGSTITITPSNGLPPTAATSSASPQPSGKPTTKPSPTAPPKPTKAPTPAPTSSGP